MKYIIYLSFMIALVLNASCRRSGAPEPRICGYKKSYVLADTIKLENCSKRYTKQRWVLPDGSPSSAGTVYFKASVPGSYQFKLYVSDDDFVNEYEAIHTVIVNP